MEFLGILEFWEEIFGNSLGIVNDCLDLWEFIALFVKIMVFVKILGKGRRRKEISILKSARGNLSHLKTAQNEQQKTDRGSQLFTLKRKLVKVSFFRK